MTLSVQIDVSRPVFAFFTFAALVDVSTGQHCAFKAGLYNIWGGVHSLGDSGVQYFSFGGVRSEWVASASYLNSI